MCLEVLVQVTDEAPGRLSAKRLAALSGLVVKAGEMDGKPALHLSVTGGCSCEFLAKGGATDESAWDLDPEHRPKLEAAIRALSSEAKKFRLLLHWLGGETERRDIRLTAKELLHLLGTNSMGNNVLYRVGHGT